jgi:hypothetical protein
VLTLCSWRYRSSSIALCEVYRDDRLGDRNGLPPAAWSIAASGVRRSLACWFRAGECPGRRVTGWGGQPNSSRSTAADLGDTGSSG